MTQLNVKKAIKEQILKLAKMLNKPVESVEGYQTLVENLGFTSLEVATLITMLETEFDVDPFTTGEASITDIQTVDELSAAYKKTLENK